MWVRKIIGFLVGAVGALLLLSLMFSGSGFQPRGGGWALLIIACGVICARLFANPKGVAKEANQKVLESTSGIRSKWWGLNKGLRLVLFACLLWFMASYFGQDNWDRNNTVVFLPIIVLLAAYFGYKHLVEDKNDNQS